MRDKGTYRRPSKITAKPGDRTRPARSRRSRLHLKRSDRLKEAFAEVSTSLRLAPDVARTQYYMAEIMSQMGDLRAH
jgi:hypothetical protein